MATKKHQFKTTNIRGKQYVEVVERIKFFRNENQYKNWTISTDITLSDDRKECIAKTIIADTEQRVIAVGHAHEVQASSNINKTSFIENCETSAVGRALGMMGIGIDNAIASANEVETAIARQDAMAKQEAKQTKAAPKKSADDDFKKALKWLNDSTDKAEAWTKIEKQATSKFTSAQLNELVEIVKAG